MRRNIVWLPLLLAGCHGLVVQTHIDPVETKVTTNMPPVSNAGPVVVVPVPTWESAVGGERIALVDVDGLLLNADFTGLASLGENPVALFREKLDAIAADHCVRAVVLRIHSPGGGVDATELMRRDLQRFRQRTKLPVIACLMDVCTGGAYYLATASDRIVATPGAIVGGVGVILNLYNLRDLMAQYNVIPQEVKSGAFTDLGTPARALSPEGKKLLQAIADDFHETIKKEVKRARPGLASADATVLDGRVFSPSQAKALGLVDAIGDLDEAIQMARGSVERPGAGVALYRRSNDPAHSIYAITPNVPAQGGLLPSLPGVDRARLPTFLCVWQPELTLERLSGK